MPRLLLFSMLALLLVACGTPAAAPTPTAAPARLVVMSHDSFSISQEVLDTFEAASGVRVEFLKVGDTGSALNQAILSRGAPLADLFFGIDNTFLSRALAADIFLPYNSPALAAIPAELQLDPELRLLPVDVGYVVLNYDRAALEASGRTPPASLEELTDPAWRGQLVVQNPATSSPGLAFLLATIAHFGEEGAYTWQSFWRDLRANEVAVSPGWSEAYYTQFSGGSSTGSHPLVVSYSTSPAAEVFFSEGALDEPPTGNLFVPGGVFRQIEFVGILRGTQNEALAQRFVDFMLETTFQSDIPLQMFVYPANPNATLPDIFTRFAEVPSQPTTLSPAAIELHRERWIEEWTDIVLR
ncbi:MAG: thiamine ABC transporter substrate-binding protein [Candidatus Viridilinea halotolerans]|uniref:Thiamine ABC transporter substrate-binding protein n=1 Tax=Candidatus Viridilinea halotolerans TaxID=2491704 RepID=A0A426U953_9CHLR|nr:MAG: thiamine ABC transporter substrate-binding protein [Candidatus Viridilinea halotolerans]